MANRFDRFLRYDELNAWLDQIAAEYPTLVSIDTYGTSFEGRDLRIVTVTDSATGRHDTKPAHWVDASIHAVELTATVAACHLINRLVSGFGVDEAVTRALKTRTFYVVPRVNPDGAEWVLADCPRFRRSSTRSWPWTDGREWPGLQVEDIDGDGRILQMRIADVHGGWMSHPDDDRLMIAVPPEGAPVGASTYRLLDEGRLVEYDSFTIPTPPPAQGLDLNRNFPAGWTTSVPGAGDHPLSEPEIDALVRAITARPNICGFNAYHTSGGVLLRPSSTHPDSKLAPLDVWTWKQIGERGSSLTGYPVHSVFEDFTWDQNATMAGASDDWAYEHLGVFSWTTEFWDIVEAATGSKQSTHFWYLGPTPDEALAVLRWCDDHQPDGFVEWRAFDHHQLGQVEIGGWNSLITWINPTGGRLSAEVEKHAEFAIFQALCSPRLEVPHTAVTRLGEGTWQVDVGIANTGWLPTDITALARKESLVRSLVAEIDGADLEVVGQPARRQLGQLEGRAALRFREGSDGTLDRILVSWTVRSRADVKVTITIEHPRCGRVAIALTLE
jgi:Zinc carboxypeptidase